MKLANYLAGQWVTGGGDGIPLIDPVRGTELVRVSSDGVDYRAALDHARSLGGPGLRALTYAERAKMLERIAQTLSSACH
jgi:3,4-dehydroadipyl-CoA semialdehyde dehydrogenase